MALTARRLAPALLIAPALLCSVLFVMLPLVCIGLYSFWKRLDSGAVAKIITLESWAELFGDSFYGSVLLDTIRLAIVTTLIAVVVGFGPAWYLTSLPPRRRGILMLLLFVPSWVSYVVRSMSWIHILGKTGLVNTVLLDTGLIAAPLPLLFNQFAVYVGMVQYVLPIVIINIHLGLATVDANVVGAARTLGAGPFQTFRAVTLPLALGGISAGCLISFIWTLGALVTPLLLGGPGTTYYANLVYDSILQQQDWPLGAALSLVSVAFLAVTLLVYNRYIGLAHIFRSAR